MQLVDILPIVEKQVAVLENKENKKNRMNITACDNFSGLMNIKGRIDPHSKTHVATSGHFFDLTQFAITGRIGPPIIFPIEMPISVTPVLFFPNFLIVSSHGPPHIPLTS